MTEPYYDDGRVTLYQGTVLDRLRELPNSSIACIVTSPPYYGLRKYGDDPDELGAEPTVEEYVDRLTEIFREARRVLADDGTLWLNLGDSYATRWGSVRERSSLWLDESHGRERRRTPAGFSPKQLLMIPARVALALQADGWILRSEIVWAKPNPMPESVTDRPTKAHEMIYLFSKSARYYFDAEAIAEPIAESTVARLGQSTLAEQHGSDRANAGQRRTSPMKATGPRFGEIIEHGMRNSRDVWLMPTMPFGGAHYAVFPAELPRRCVRAGARPAGRRCDCDELVLSPTSPGGMPDPTDRVGRAGMSRPRRSDEGVRPITRRQQRADAAALRELEAAIRQHYAAEFTGWDHYMRTDRAGARPLPPDLRAGLLSAGFVHDVEGPCEHPVEPAGVVLDPFSGSGTTGMVALQEGHPFIGIDLYASNLDLSLRTRLQSPPLDLGGLAQ